MDDVAQLREPITSKAMMYGLLSRGLLGHTLPSAETPEAVSRLVAAGGTFAVRSKQAGGPCRYGLTAEETLALASSLPPGTWNASPMLEDEGRVCYAHLYDAVGGWFLHYSEDRKPCRLNGDCNELYLGGLAARHYLRRTMDQCGWDTLCELIEAYPYHVYEFSVMSSCRAAWGPTRVIFWEVRCDGGRYELSGWKDPRWHERRGTHGD